MSDNQRLFSGQEPFSSTSIDSSLAAVLDIAERALWNPAKVAHEDIQKMAAAVVSYMRRRTPMVPDDGAGQRSADRME